LLRRRRIAAIVVAAAVGAGCCCPLAAATRPDRVEGGSAHARAQVARALAASDFDWSTIRARVTVHIGDFESRSTAGHVWLNERLLTSGTFSWGVVLHEFAHQVDFLMLDAADRERLRTAFGVAEWFPGRARLRHEAYGCERFASTFAWSFWPSRANSMRPSAVGDESSSMPPPSFRRLVQRLLAEPS
jgi:hypothetical protein